MTYIKAALLGNPVTHSLSPAIHNYWIRHYGLGGEYSAINMLAENLKNALPSLVAEGYSGFNVTVPLKEVAIDLCNTLEASAAKIGAVNTIAIQSNGLSKGLNTDVFGFTRSLKEACPTSSFEDKVCMVIGAGGAAKAVAEALFLLGVKQVIITNRTKDKFAHFIKNYKAQIVDWKNKEEALAACTLLVNATSLGMKGMPPLEIDLKYLPIRSVVYDVVYAPQKTEILKQAQDRGHIAVGGLGMLLHQARPAFKAWFGIMPEITGELKEMVVGE